MFSEGGGNTWGLDFDAHGNVMAGTNYGNAVCLHQVQGGYYIKGFSKHGPLHNPFTYGYFEHAGTPAIAAGTSLAAASFIKARPFPRRFANAYIGANSALERDLFRPDRAGRLDLQTRYVGTLL